MLVLLLRLQFVGVNHLLQQLAGVKVRLLDFEVMILDITDVLQVQDVELDHLVAALDSLQQF